MIILNNNDILLFQGDSITHGGRVESDWDMNHIIGHGYQSILASRIGYENLKSCPKIINRGVSGDSTENLCERWERDALLLKPTVLSLLIGVNDSLMLERTNTHPTPDMSEKNLRSILNKTVAQNPEIKLIIGEPFAFLPPQAQSDGDERKKLLRRIEVVRDIAERTKTAARDFGAVFVEYRSTLEKYIREAPSGHIVWDGIHPTYVGHEIMARLWYKTVDESEISGSARLCGR